MINFKKISIIFYSIGFCFTPIIAEEKLHQQSYAYGYHLGSLNTVCFLYKDGHISEENAKSTFESILSFANVEIDSKKRIKLLYSLFENEELTEVCNKLMPSSKF